MAVATTSDFDATFFIDEVIEEAFSMIGGEPELGNDGITARRSLKLLLTDWQNRGVLLWGTDIKSTVLTQNVAEYTLDDDTVDVLNGYIRLSSNSNAFQMNRMSYEEYVDINKNELNGLTYDQILKFLNNFKKEERLEKYKKLNPRKIHIIINNKLIFLKYLFPQINFILQKKIICNAHAFKIFLRRTKIHNKKIIIQNCDTPFIPESEILKTLMTHKGKITVIFITHRIKSLKNCDNILFFQDGKIFDRGKYNYLIKNNKKFELLSRTEEKNIRI